MEKDETNIEVIDAAFQRLIDELSHHGIGLMGCMYRVRPIKPRTQPEEPWRLIQPVPGDPRSCVGFLLPEGDGWIDDATGRSIDEDRLIGDCILSFGEALEELDAQLGEEADDE